MFDTLNLLILLLAPVLAYTAGAMMFFVYELMHNNTAQPLFAANRNCSALVPGDTLLVN